MSSTWNSVTGDWSDSSDWTGGVPDDPTALALITASGTYTVTIAATESFQAGAVTLDDADATVEDDGVLDVSGALTITAGDVDLSGSAASASFGGVTNDGDQSFELHNGAYVTVNGDFYNNSAGNTSMGFGASCGLEVDSNPSDGGSSLTITGTLANTGRAQVGLPYYGGATTTVTLGGLTNSAQAAFTVWGSSSHVATLAFTGIGAGFTSNGGFFQLGYVSPLTLTEPNGFTNTGIFDIESYTSLTIDGDFANSGTLDADSYTGETLPDRAAPGGGGSSLTITGTLTNTGTVQIDLGDQVPTTVTLGGLINSAGATFTVFGWPSDLAILAFTKSGAGFTSNGGSFYLTSVSPLTLTEPNGFANSGNFELGENPSLTVDGGFANSGTLGVDTLIVLSEHFADGGSSLTTTGTLTNTGATQIGNIDAPAATTATLGGLTNSASGNFTVGGSSAGPATVTVTGPVDNAGALNIDANSVFDVSGGAVFTQTAGTTNINGSFSASTIDVDGGNFLVDVTNFTNTGTLAAADGGDINLGAGGLTNLSGGTLTGGTYTVGAGSTLQLPDNTPIVTDDADIILSGAGSTIEDDNTATSSFSAIDQTLLTIGASGELELLAGRNWTTPNAAANDGLIELGGGTLAATGSSASLTDAAGAKLLGYGTVTANAFTNSGTIEASGGTLTVTNAIGGTGALEIDGGANLTLGGAVATGATATFNGANATLTLDEPASFAASLGGFAFEDTIDLLGVTANSATVNGANQLVVSKNGASVDTLRLSGPYPGLAFAVVANAGGSDIVALPVPATVAQYLSATSLYDDIAGGFTISDTTSDVAAAFGDLNADPHISSIQLTNSGIPALSLTAAQATGDTTALKKITNPLFEAIAPSLPPTYYAGGNGATGTPIAFSASNSSVNLKANSNMALTGSSDSVYSGANSTFSATGGSDYLDLLGSGDSVTLSGTSGNWDWIDGSSSSITLNGAQTDVSGGGNTIAYASGSGDAADLYNTGGSADTVTATGSAVYLNSAQAKVTGGGDWVDFQSGSGNAVTLAGTSNNWDWVTAAGGTVDFNGAQATVAGGGDTIAFQSGSGNSLAITGTGGSADSITASSSNVYMLGAQAKVTGGGDWVDFQSGTDSVTLANTNNSWDWVTAAGGTVDFNGAQATVAGGGDTIAFQSGSGNSVALTGTGGSADSLTASNSAVYLLGAQANVAGGGDWVDFQSGTDSVTLANTNNNWDWVTAAGGTVNLNSAQSVVQGGGDTIALTGTGSAASLSGTGGSADTVTSSNGLLYLNGAQAHVSGNSNTLYMGGSTATASGNSDSFAFLAGFGQDSVTGFNSTDTIQLPAADFASWNALQSHMTQSGANTVIALDASDAITLVGVTKSSLTQAEFSFK